MISVRIIIYLIEFMGKKLLDMKTFLDHLREWNISTDYHIDT